MAEYIADGTPEEIGIFRGLAQAPLHFHNAIAELIDNSIAAKNSKFTLIFLKSLKIQIPF